MTFELQPGHPLLVNVPTPHLEQAIALYDQRVAILGGGLLGAGMRVVGLLG
jgi:hypothetical protein